MKTNKTHNKKSLLSKNLRLFAACIAVCFALTAPLFYLLTKWFYAEDMIDIIESVKQGQGIPPLDLERDVMAGMMLQFMLIFIVFAIALFITMRFVTRRLWLPFDDTLHKAEQFSLAQSEVPDFADTDIFEFDRLNRSLRQLMQKDKDTYRIQKEFTENASHELQTPLAIIRTKLDLLMQENLNEKQSQIVSQLYDMAIRMGHLNRNLLLLAKIENAQYAHMDEVDITALLSESLPLYQTISNGAKLRVENRCSKQGGKLRANDILLECLLKNLIVNGIRHSVPGSEVLITIEDRRLTVSNSAAQGKALDNSTLFCRFRSGDGQQKGNGLGLAIVKAICDFHHWRVSYRFAEGRHHFVVDFQS